MNGPLASERDLQMDPSDLSSWVRGRDAKLISCLTPISQLICSLRTSDLGENILYLEAADKI